jgi:hypothetical protein
LHTILISPTGHRKPFIGLSWGILAAFSRAPL